MNLYSALVVLCLVVESIGIVPFAAANLRQSASGTNHSVGVGPGSRRFERSDTLPVLTEVPLEKSKLGSLIDSISEAIQDKVRIARGVRRALSIFDRKTMRHQISRNLVQILLPECHEVWTHINDEAWFVNHSFQQEKSASGNLIQGSYKKNMKALFVGGMEIIPVIYVSIKEKEIFIEGPLVGLGGFKRVYLGFKYPEMSQVAISHIPIKSTENSQYPQDSVNAVVREIKTIVAISQKKEVEDLKLLHRRFDRVSSEVILIQSYYDEGTLLSFTEKLMGKGQQSIKVKKEIALQLLGQLKAVHDLGYVHFDIKPHNVLVKKGSKSAVEILLSDFGLAEKIENTTTHWKTRGTPGYMAPEVIRGPDLLLAQADSRATALMDDSEWGTLMKKTDVWSLGVTLYGLLDGQQGCQSNRNHKANAFATMHATGSMWEVQDLCTQCGFFCHSKCDRKNSPEKCVTVAPALGTYASVVFQMMDPNPRNRITLGEAAQALNKISY